MPAPPYFSGKMTPRNPISASLGMISEGNFEASSHSMTCGAISPSANSRTVRRSCCCSSVREKSIERLYHGPLAVKASATGVEHRSGALEIPQPWGGLKSQRRDACAAAHGAKREVGERANQQRRIVQRRHHVELFDAERFGLLAGFDVYFVQGFDVLGKEGDRNHQHAALTLARHPLDCAGERRCQPLLRTYATLVAEHVRVAPRPHLANELHRGFDLFRVRVALFHQRHGQAVSAEDQMDVFG